MSETTTLSAGGFTFDYTPPEIPVCPLCEEREAVPAWKDVAEHLVITIDKRGHTHVHGPMGNKEVLRKMRDTLSGMI